MKKIYYTKNKNIKIIIKKIRIFKIIKIIIALNKMIKN